MEKTRRRVFRATSFIHRRHDVRCNRNKREVRHEPLTGIHGILITIRSTRASVNGPVLPKFKPRINLWTADSRTIGPVFTRFLYEIFPHVFLQPGRLVPCSQHPEARSVRRKNR